ncbi:23S rRNA (adenine(2030)-N(6))-methyltransferase RlmJ [Salinibius halmophilus]|uniref:23S rRNA (adenine(2030)-N(6))-methyltransferase RlmJ n=1 Tax=Salinibius halmophilus TaxID=1853216 RepID=UPI000E667886|nr:23S rRNA (adenine(2030)-N(6))-methyltransferase RlmJ [Salinibius halmophilus]
MLSYLHGFHAGNHADVLKHFVLVQAFAHFQKKAAFHYIDTHAGGGLYSLTSERGQKIAEYEDGIAKINSQDEFPEPLAEYLALINTLNEVELSVYPGSAKIAQLLARQEDQIRLFEQHPKEFEALKRQFKQRNIKLYRENGWDGLLSHVPPASKRALVLIDPPYEDKAEYNLAAEKLKQVYKRFSSGTYMLWYPMVERPRIDHLTRSIKKSGIKNVLWLELNVRADHSPGMSGSGMIVVNPPWTLQKEAETVMPWLIRELAQDNKASFKNIMLVAE